MGGVGLGQGGFGVRLRLRLEVELEWSGLIFENPENRRISIHDFFKGFRKIQKFYMKNKLFKKRIMMKEVVLNRSRSESSITRFSLNRGG